MKSGTRNPTTLVRFHPRSSAVHFLLQFHTTYVEFARALRGRVTGLDWYATYMEIAKARKDENAKEFRAFALSRFRDSRGLQVDNEQTMRRLAVNW
jgi:hypothetical protein